MDKPRVTGILKAAGLIDFSMVPQGIMERAQSFGTAVHLTTELYDKGTLDMDSLDPSLVPYLDGWKKFLKDYNITIKPDEMEKQFESKRYGFKGSPDRWPEIAGKITVVDIKTSTQMYAATAVQTMAYQMLLEENGVKPKERKGVQLTGDGLYKIEPYTDSSDKSVFLSALNLYRFKQRKGML